MENKDHSLYEIFKSLFYMLFLGLAVYIAGFFGYENLNLKRTAFALDQINENMHKNFSAENDYPAARVIKEKNIAPQDMAEIKAKEYFWRHYFGGNMLISGVKKAKEPIYNVIFNNLSKRKCKLLANNDWRDNRYFVGIALQGYSVIAKNAGDEFLKIERLITKDVADKLCSCKNGDSCSVILVYR